MTAVNPSASILRGRIVAPDQLTAGERELWRELCAAAPALAHPFHSFVFAECVARVHRDVRVCILERADKIEGFFPYQFANVLARALWMADQIGGSMVDYFGVVARPSLRMSPAELLGAAGLDVLPFHHLAAEQVDFGPVGEQSRRCHRIVIGNDSAEYWRRLKADNKRLVSEMDRCLRKMVELYGPIRFEFAVGDPIAKLARLIAEKRKQYLRTAAEDALAAPWKRGLLQELAQSTDPDCTGVLSELYAGDTWVASHFGLRNRHTLHYWFPVYNRALAKFGPGHLLLRHLIEYGPALGVKTIDLGEGDQPHKTMWVTEWRNLYWGLWKRPSARGFAARVLLATGWRFRALAPVNAMLLFDAIGTAIDAVA